MRGRYTRQSDVLIVDEDSVTVGGKEGDVEVLDGDPSLGESDKLRSVESGRVLERRNGKTSGTILRSDALKCWKQEKDARG
jgi:hypothetical protein